MSDIPSFTAIVLAAGQGTRMKSDVPKVLHRLAGRALVEFSVRAAFEAGAEKVVLVTSGHSEIDALATLQPRELAQILRDALAPFYDADLGNRVYEARIAWEAEAQAWLDQQMDVKALARFQREASERLDAVKADIAAINDGIRLAVGDDYTLPTATIPEPEIDPALHGKPLVSSSWEWTDQTRALIARKSYGAKS